IYFLYPVSTVLADGKVLVTCGTVGGDASIYDPAKNAWKDAALALNHSLYCTLTTLNDGRVLLAGGFDGMTYHNSADLYDPAQDRWQSAPPMRSARSERGAAKLKDGRVLVTGGFDGMTFLKTAEIYEAGGPLGSGCAGAQECTSGFCVSGVCCESACDAVDEC